LAAALLAAGHAYERDGNVYFRGADIVERAGLPRQEALALSVEYGDDPDDPRRDDPFDVPVWRRSAGELPAWPSPWGTGRPGWPGPQDEFGGTERLGDVVIGAALQSADAFLDAVAGGQHDGWHAAVGAGGGQHVQTVDVG